jgi:hypothetical protein
MRFPTTDGAILVEVDATEPGFERATLKGAIMESPKRFEESLANMGRAVASALEVVRNGSANPDGVEIEFGVRLNAEVGAVIAKTSLEGHLMVKLIWHGQPTTA